MNITRDIQSLTMFKRQTNDIVKQLRKTGEPVILTVNGKAELVVQDAAAYQAMMDRIEAIEGIREGLKDAQDGHVVSAKSSISQLRKRHAALSRRSDKKG